MLRVSTLVVLLVALASSGCAGDDPPPALEDRVRALLEAEPGTVSGDLEGARVLCPTIQDVVEGDLATCVVTFADDHQTEVDVEFGPGGAITVVGVQDR